MKYQNSNKLLNRNFTFKISQNRKSDSSAWILNKFHCVKQAGDLTLYNTWNKPLKREVLEKTFTKENRHHHQQKQEDSRVSLNW